MQEEIIDFNEMVENYYKNLGFNMVFDFLHVSVSYTYIDLNSRNIEFDRSNIPSYSNDRRRITEMIFIPIVIPRNKYDKYFGNDEHYCKRTFVLDGNVDIGNSYNFNYERLYREIKRQIPRKCHIIDYNEMRLIGKTNGYENIFWNIQDENADELSDYDLEPVWRTKVYGVKMDICDNKLIK